jgi:type IV secretory pathway VirB10-like protein
MLIACGSSGTSKVDQEDAAEDDLTHFVARYGKPDFDTSSEHEVPRPPMVTRRIVYRSENLRVVYLADVEPGSPPPYKGKWKFVGFQNNKTNEVVEPADAANLLAHRDSTRPRRAPSLPPDSSANVAAMRAEEERIKEERDRAERLKRERSEAAIADEARVAKQKADEEAADQAKIKAIEAEQARRAKEKREADAIAAAKAEEIAAKEKAEKDAAQRLGFAKVLLRDPDKKVAAINALSAIVQMFPDTKAGKEAAELLKKRP